LRALREVELTENHEFNDANSSGLQDRLKFGRPRGTLLDFDCVLYEKSSLRKTMNSTMEIRPSWSRSPGSAEIWSSWRHALAFRLWTVARTGGTLQDVSISYG
jgi:hypothetical protein